jgi:hypothetical protein
MFRHTLKSRHARARGFFLFRAAAIVLLLMLCNGRLQTYSVLTHEEIVDLHSITVSAPIPGGVFTKALELSSRDSRWETE